MKVTVNGHLYTIGWHYESKLINKLCSKKNISYEEIKGLRKHQICEKLGIKAYPLPERTHCVITNEDTGQVMRVNVRRDSRDPWKRDRARRESLEKAIWYMFPEHGDPTNRACRTAFWDAYNGRRKNDPIANIKRCLKFGVFTMNDLKNFIMPPDTYVSRAEAAKIFHIH